MALKGNIPWNKGLKGQIPWNKGLKGWTKGYWLGKKRKTSDGIFLKGHKVSQEMKEKMSRSHKGKPSSMGMLNKKHSFETKKKMSLAQGGTGIPIRPTKRYYHRQDRKYKEWRSKVFERDNWTCQTCGKRGCYLEPHHIKGWTKYPELRYDVENGVTLCLECHRLTRKIH